MDTAPKQIFTKLAGACLAGGSTFLGWRRTTAKTAPTTTSEPASALGRALVRSAAHERILLLYIVGLFVAVLHGTASQRGSAELLLALDFGLLLLAIVMVRGPLLSNRFGVALVSRLIVFGGLIGSFFQLDVILTAARTSTVDLTLHAIDLTVFGFEPATVLDQYVTHGTTEWFSFFYFSYFVLLAVHVLPFMFVERRLDLVAEFALGMVVVYCVGQLTYVIVPGFGPYRSLTFTHELEGGRFWHLVQSGATAVNESMRTDIFPSLHTGGPTFLSLFSFRHRARLPFRYTWPVTSFFTTQIIIATMFLRWHYLIDVVAGITLAVVAVKVGARASREAQTRLSAGLSALWTPLTLSGVVPPAPRPQAIEARSID